jgi:hypothetical protein
LALGEQNFEGHFTESRGCATLSIADQSGWALSSLGLGERIWAESRYEFTGFGVQMRIEVRVT